MYKTILALALVSTTAFGQGYGNAVIYDQMHHDRQVELERFRTFSNGRDARIRRDASRQQSLDSERAAQQRFLQTLDSPDYQY